MIASNGFSFQTKKKVVDTDKVEINRTENRTLTWTPLAGGIAVAAGIAILLVTRKRTRENKHQYGFIIKAEADG